MLRLITAAALAVGLATSSAGCIIVTDDDATLTIYNDSSYVLEEVYLAEVRDRTWGPNLLSRPLFPGDELIIYDIACGNYDVMVVDDYGLDCVLENLRLCFSDDYWVIDDVTLAICDFTR
jgi:hypothetical protein